MQTDVTWHTAKLHHLSILELLHATFPKFSDIVMVVGMNTCCDFVARVVAVEQNNRTGNRNIDPTLRAVSNFGDFGEIHARARK